MRPKVSVIVPCYNAEKTVERTLDSLVSQTLQDIEILAINDGSKDSTLKVICDYRDSHPDHNIVVYTKPNEGLAMTRTFGIEKATGEYMAFVDSDDYVDAEMCEDMYTLAEKDGLDVVVADFYWTFPKKEVVQKDGPYQLGQDMMVKMFISMCNKLYRTEFIRSLDFDFIAEYNYEDTGYLYRIIPFVKKIGFTNKPYLHYVQQNNSITHTDPYRVNHMMPIFDIIVNYYQDKGFYEEYKQALEYLHVKFFLGSCFRSACQIKNGRERNRTIRLGYDYLVRRYPNWKNNPYLQSLGGLKNRYFSMINDKNITLFGLLFHLKG